MVNEFSIDRLTTEPNQKQVLLQIFKEVLSNGVKPIVLFGSGTIGRYYLQYLKTMDPSMEIYFCDNNPSKWGTFVEGVAVISFDELKTQYRESYIIISSIEYYDEIFIQLKRSNLSCIFDSEVHHVLLDTFKSSYTLEVLYKDYVSLIKENINQFRSVYSFLSDELSKKIFCERINYTITANSKYLTPLQSNSPQYFASDIIKLSDDEIFIDGGAYIGDTIEEFLKQAEGKFNKIYAFEPEESKHNEIEKIVEGHEGIEIMPYGLWSRKDVLRFHSNNDFTSSVGEDGNVEVSVISIDEVLTGGPVTFIKMDIEGAELEALKGAEMSIRKYKPKLAICVYHKPLDIVEIPLYLKELVPEYKIYIRQYSDNIHEIVCYAVIE